MAYPAGAPVFKQVKDAFYNPDGTLRYAAAFTGGTLKAFDPVTAIRRKQIGRLQNWCIKLVRDNEMDASADFKGDLTSQQNRSTNLRNHCGVVVSELASAGIYVVLSMLDRQWGLDRNASVRSACATAGRPMTGAASLYSDFGYGSGEDYGNSHDSLRKFLVTIAIAADGGTYQTAHSGAKPGPNGSSANFGLLVDAIWAWIAADIADWKAKLFWNANKNFIIPQLCNGPECAKDISFEKFRETGYFGPTNKLDLKQPTSTALAVQLGAAVPSVAGSGGYSATWADADSAFFARYEWAAKVLSDLLYGDINSSNAIMQFSLHWYKQGHIGYRPNFVGKYDSQIVTEFNISKPFLVPDSGADGSSDRPATGDVYQGSKVGDPCQDADDCWYVHVDTGQPLVLGTSPGNAVSLGTDLSAADLKTALLNLPGFEGTPDDLYILAGPSGFSAFTQFRAPAGRDIHQYMIRMGLHGSPDSKSKYKRTPVNLYTPNTSTTQIFKAMHGGTCDRGEGLKQMVKELVALGVRIMFFHSPFDSRGGGLQEAADGSTDILWTPGSAATPNTYEWWRKGNYPPSPTWRAYELHTGVPFISEEPGSLAFLDWFGPYLSSLNDD